MKRLFNSRGESEIEPGDRTGRNTATAQQPPPAATQEPAQKPYVLYLKANDSPSSQAYRLAVPVLNLIEVQDTRQLKPGQIPPFLKGVPTLLDIRKREAYPGKICLQFLEKLSERPVYDVESTILPQDAYSGGGGENAPGAIGSDDGYAPCDFLPSDPSLYQSGKRNKEDINGIINKLMEERTSDRVSANTGDRVSANTGQPSPAEMSKILQSMLET